MCQFRESSGKRCSLVAVTVGGWCSLHAMVMCQSRLAPWCGGAALKDDAPTRIRV